MECNVSYLRVIFLLYAICFSLESSEIESNMQSSESLSKDSTLESKDSKDSTLQSDEKSSEILDYEFPKYEDNSILNSFLARFSLHEENYFLPIFYQTNVYQINTNPSKQYKNYEAKFQFSAKANIFSDLFWGVGAYFAYTQKSFFQIYSPKISSPFRNNDYIPELMLYKPLDIPLFGGEIYNIRFGFKHTSNGEMVNKHSRGIDMIMAEIMYKVSSFRLKLKAWAYIRKDPPEIDKYLGYSSLILEYDFLVKNSLRLSIGNLFHNYAKYKGNVMLEYKYNFEYFAFYVQYFYGYGDNILEYKTKKHGVGVGAAIARF